MADMHDGCVHTGLRYSVILRGIPPHAHISFIRNDINIGGVNHSNEATRGFENVLQTTTCKIFGIVMCSNTQSLTDLVEKAIAKVREYDAVIEIFAPEEEKTS